MRLILASASPRRLDLLERLGVVPDEIRPADISEIPEVGELPRSYCRRVAREKACSFPSESGSLVLAADTAVALGRSILGKPESADEAEEFLHRLSGRRHRVITAVALAADGRLLERDVVSVVRMKRLAKEEIADYLKSGEWQGKAGGYGIQGRAGAFIPWIRGSFSAIVGLPLAETANLLRAAGHDVPGKR